MNEIGIRQGRLSPSTIGPIQRFPQTSWKDEFESARACGFAFIEWLLSADGCLQNPIWSDEAAGDIRALVADTGVKVRSLSADYFMAHPLVRCSNEERTERERLLRRLIVRSVRIGIHVIVLPLLENADIHDVSEFRALRASLDESLDLASTLSVTLALEADLPAEILESLLDGKPHPALGVCYDTGNAAARGFDLAADLRRLGPRLRLVHIKDRDPAGTSVELGSGTADFSRAFRTLADAGYEGPLTLETPRGSDSIASAKRNLGFVRAGR